MIWFLDVHVFIITSTYKYSDNNVSQNFENLYQEERRELEKSNIHVKRSKLHDHSQMFGSYSYSSQGSNIAFEVPLQQEIGGRKAHARSTHCPLGEWALRSVSCERTEAEVAIGLENELRTRPKDKESPLKTLQNLRSHL